MAKKKTVKNPVKKLSKPTKVSSKILVPVDSLNDITRGLSSITNMFKELRDRLVEWDKKLKTRSDTTKDLVVMLMERCNQVLELHDNKVDELRNLPEAVLTIATEARKNQEKLEGALGQLSEQLPLHYSAVAHPDSTVIIATLQERIKEMSRGVDEQFLQFATQVKEKWDNLQNRMVAVERFFDMGGPIVPKPDGTERTTEPPMMVEYVGVKYYRVPESDKPND